jgi:AraC-like DNA-binding protein
LSGEGAEPAPAKPVPQARALLEQADLPMKEISWRLGFAHPAAFTTAFRRAAGMSPAQYRRR